MKLNWIISSVISAVLLFPFIAIAENGTPNDNSSAELNKPDSDPEDPLSGAEIIITKSQQRTIAEYRLNGRLVQVKITPKHGYSYYLIDTDGNGTLDMRSSEAWKNTTVNTWKIFQW